MQWFRLYHEIVADRKLRRLSPEHRWLWVSVLATASASPQRGALLVTTTIPATVDDLADIALLSPEIVAEGLALFVESGMLTLDGTTYRVTAWDRRQFTSDNSTERSRTHRQRAREAAEFTPTEFTLPASPPPTIPDPPASSSPSESDLHQLAVTVAAAAHLSDSDEHALAEIIANHQARNLAINYVTEARKAAEWVAAPAQHQKHITMNLRLLDNWFGRVTAAAPTTLPALDTMTESEHVALSVALSENWLRVGKPYTDAQRREWLRDHRAHFAMPRLAIPQGASP